MYIVCVTIRVKPELVTDFIAATRENQLGTRTHEPGNVQWDFLQGEDDPTAFFIYEAYHTKDDFPLHQAMPHYLTWRDAVAPMMAEPRVGKRYFSVDHSVDCSVDSSVVSSVDS